MESEETNKLIIDSFIDFVTDYNLIDKENIEMTIDETVGAYIANTIQQLYTDYENHKVWLDDEFASDFDIDNFVEIIDAYLFGFSSLETNKIKAWLISLKKLIDNLNDNKKCVQIEVQNLPAEKDIDENDSKGTLLTRKSSQDKNDLVEDANMNLLIEMFPQMKVKDINKVYKKSNCNYESTIDQLLTIQNATVNDSEEDDEIKLELKEKERLALKEKTVQRFGFVPVSENGSVIEAKPPAPSQVWNSEKKLVRYYDSKVVTTKGEKFFELKTEEDIEHEKAMKKTYCNLKPARKYRFH